MGERREEKERLPYEISGVARRTLQTFRGGAGCAKLMEECSIRGCGQYHRREDIASQATNRLRGHFNLLKRGGTNFVAVDKGCNFGTVINQ